MEKIFAQCPRAVVGVEGEGEDMSATKPKSILVSALGYLKSGWPVFPCNPINKRPLTKHGFKDASRDPEVVKEWWAQWPHAMIGIPMGSASGVFCVDLDKKDGKDGVKTWTQLEQDNSPAPITRQYLTPSTGQHLLFTYVNGIRNIPLHKIAPGI